MKLFSIFNFKLNSVLRSLRGLGIEPDSLRIDELRGQGVDPVTYCECLKLISEYALPVSIEQFNSRVDSGRSFQEPVAAMIQLQNGSRQFSWQFLCDIEDSGIGAEAFIETYFSQTAMLVEKERVESLEKKNNTYSIEFYKGLLYHIESNYVKASDCFELAVKECCEAELLYYYAESLYRSKADDLSPELIVTAMSIVHTEPELIYRLADLFLVEQVIWLEENSAAVDTLLQYLLPLSRGSTVPGDLKKQIGSLYRLRKAYQNALEWFSKVSEEDQEDQFMWYECYLCYKELDDSENAEAALENVQVGFYDPEEVIACFEK